MAERVQQDLELMITELEQMQRVGLLSAEETKMVIKKRKRFEYKMQKQTKIKEDILAYIQYECSLLDLIELRRDKIGYLHKKNEIDDAIAKRIHRLFKITEHRFGHVDEKVWITHLGKSKFHEKKNSQSIADLTSIWIKIFRLPILFNISNFRIFKRERALLSRF